MVSFLGINYLIPYNKILFVNVKDYNSFFVNYYQLGQNFK
jgi:hypothetical protein